MSRSDLDHGERGEAGRFDVDHDERRPDESAATHDPDQGEVPVLPNQDSIATLADRIAQAFARRYPDWSSSVSSPGVWVAAASGLLLLSHNAPELPVDPEMFVAVQPKRTWPDPWSDLTSDASLRRYRRHVRQVILQLREEIRGEVRMAERRVRRGLSLTAVLESGSAALSPLGRYVIARRAGHDDLAERLRPEAERQHRSCPLYLQACRRLLPLNSYPLPRPAGLLPGFVIPAGLELPCFSMN